VTSCEKRHVVQVPTRSALCASKKSDHDSAVIKPVFGSLTECFSINIEKRAESEIDSILCGFRVKHGSAQISISFCRAMPASESATATLRCVEGLWRLRAPSLRRF